MADEKISPVEMIHRAMQERGDVGDDELAAFIQERFGTRIAPRFIPVLKASVREREVIERARQAARELAERLQAEQAAAPRKTRGKRTKQGVDEERQAAPHPATADEPSSGDPMPPPEIRSSADSGEEQPAA